MVDNIEDADYEIIPSPSNKTNAGLGKYIKAHILGAMEGLRSKTLNKQVNNQQKRLENDIIDIILELASSISITDADIVDIQKEKRFLGLSAEEQKRLLDNLQKGAHKNAAEEAKKQKKEEDSEKLNAAEEARKEKKKEDFEKLKNKRMKMINQINELLEKAEQDLIDGKYYDAISQAKEAKEEIEYNKEWLLGLQTLLNNTLFKIKKMKEIFSKNKSNMTTRCLPEGIDTILKQKEKLAEAIIGEAQAALKKDTKKRIENLAHPQEVTQNIIGTRKPHYQGSLIVSLSNGVQTLLVKNRIPKKNLLIVQQTDGKRLRTIFNTDGEPVIPVYIKSGYRITGDKIFYKTKDDEPETEGSLS